MTIFNNHRIPAAALALVLVLSLTGCGTAKDAPAGENTASMESISSEDVLSGDILNEVVAPEGLSDKISETEATEGAAEEAAENAVEEAPDVVLPEGVVDETPGAAEFYQFILQDLPIVHRENQVADGEQHVYGKAMEDGSVVFYEIACREKIIFSETATTYFPISSVTEEELNSQVQAMNAVPGVRAAWNQDGDFYRLRRIMEPLDDPDTLLACLEAGLLMELEPQELEASLSEFSSLPQEEQHLSQTGFSFLASQKSYIPKSAYLSLHADSENQN